MMWFIGLIAMTPQVDIEDEKTRRFREVPGRCLGEKEAVVNVFNRIVIVPNARDGWAKITVKKEGESVVAWRRNRARGQKFLLRVEPAERYRDIYDIPGRNQSRYLNGYGPARLLRSAFFRPHGFPILRQDYATTVAGKKGHVSTAHLFGEGKAWTIMIESPGELPTLLTEMRDQLREW